MKQGFFWRRFSAREISLILEGLDLLKDEYEDEILVLINAIKRDHPDEEDRLREPLRDQVGHWRITIERLKQKVISHLKIIAHGT